MSKKWFFGLLVLFLVGGLSAGLLYRRSKVLIAGQQEEQTEKVLVTNLASLPGDPIVKKPYIDNQGVEYELRGSFTDKLLDQGGLLAGVFKINGDPLERKIRVFVGGADSHVFLGTYEESFEGSSSWERTPNAFVVESVEPGETVIIRHSFEFTGIEGEEGALVGMQQILDNLIEEFNSGKYELEIPADFALVSTRLGVVR